MQQRHPNHRGWSRFGPGDCFCAHVAQDALTSDERKHPVERVDLGPPLSLGSFRDLARTLAHQDDEFLACKAHQPDQ
jgi:hypothetical protein